jgi:ketosteroid isomerase-like protein
MVYSANVAQVLPDHFVEFMRDRERAVQAFVNGDYEPSRPLTTTADPATFFDPFGGVHTGAADVAAVYERNCGLFAGGATTVETLQLEASETVGYWVYLQTGTSTLRGSPTPIALALRVTEVYRREDGGWKLVHRHADPAARG